MVYHVIPAEAGIQDSQGDMNILDSGDPVQQLISPPLVASGSESQRLGEEGIKGRGKP
jgi:hypothetical protein